MLDPEFAELSKNSILVDHDLRGPPWGLADRLSTLLDGLRAPGTGRQMLLKPTIFHPKWQASLGKSILAGRFPRFQRVVFDFVAHPRSPDPGRSK